MYKLYSTKEFDNAKLSQKLPLKCKHCKNTFFRKKSIIIFVESPVNEKQKGKISFCFCSPKCAGLNKKKPKIVLNCSQCNKELNITQFFYKKSITKRFFCNKSCAATYNNKTPKRKKTSIKALCLYCNKQYERPLSKINKGRANYCSNVCNKKHKEEKYYDLFCKGKLLNKKHIRNFIIQNNGYKCSVCGLTAWNNQPINLWVDHIDGNASNNLPSNLRLICLNCDSQSSTFGGRNIGKGRGSLGLKKWGVRRDLNSQCLSASAPQAEVFTIPPRTP